MRKRGKRLKTATFALAYGSSVLTASSKSGLGLRRTNVLSKDLRNHTLKV